MLGGVTKKNVKQQKVILVQKRPAKAATMVADEYDDERHDLPEKSVSFSSEDEVLEIEARPVPKQFNIKKTTNVSDIKTRLGMYNNCKLSRTCFTNSLIDRRTWFE